MRYLFLITFLFFLLAANITRGQNNSNQGAKEVSQDYSLKSFITSLPGIDTKSLQSNQKNSDFEMPIYNPRSEGAKILVWRPSPGYDYNMPNLYAGKESRLNFGNRNKKNR